MGSAWYFPFYDNNGNITAYADETGAIAAEYTYDAFGRTIASTGLHADAFRHRFSTKYLDVETGFYYYGYRFYAPELMRWLNRDPLHETGFISVFLQSPEGAAAYFQAMGGVLADEELQNLCRFVMNNPLSGVDPYGLDSRFWDGMQCMADCTISEGPACDAAWSAVMTCVSSLDCFQMQVWSVGFPGYPCQAEEQAYGSC